MISLDEASFAIKSQNSEHYSPETALGEFRKGELCFPASVDGL